MDSELGGKVALVTGGGKGIGKAIAESLARRGARVAVAGRNLPAVESVARSIGGFALSLDVRDETSVRAMIAEALGWGGRLDILVNNAGIGLLVTPISDTATAAWNDVLATNLTGTFLVSREAWPHLAASQGQILNVASVSGVRGFPGASAYCASKYGVMGLTEVLKLEGSPLGIRTMALCPGAIDTEIWGEWATDEEKGRMMTPAQVGELAAQMLAAPHNIDLGPWVVLNARDPFSSP